MARPLRLEFEDAIYHITARGNRRERIFANEGGIVPVFWKSWPGLWRVLR